MAQGVLDTETPLIVLTFDIVSGVEGQRKGECVGDPRCSPQALLAFRRNEGSGEVADSGEESDPEDGPVTRVL